MITGIRGIAGARVGIHNADEGFAEAGDVGRAEEHWMS